MDKLICEVMWYFWFALMGKIPYNKDFLKKNLTKLKHDFRQI